METQAPSPSPNTSQTACSHSGLKVQSEGRGYRSSPSSQRQQKHLCHRAQYIQEEELIGQLPMQNLAGSHAKLA